MTAADWIDNLARLAEAAQRLTPGEWVAGDGWVYTRPVYDDDNRLASVLGMKYADRDRANAEHARAQRNAEFIAAANPATILRLIEELRQARETNRRLHRRVQRAESGVLETVEDCRRAGISLGRMLANSAATHYREAAHAIAQDLAGIAAERDQWREMYQAQVHLAHVSDMKVARVEALADETEQAGDPLLRLDHLRTALTEVTTDTTKETP